MFSSEKFQRKLVLALIQDRLIVVAVTPFARRIAYHVDFLFRK
jgi:hypothetical protein